MCTSSSILLIPARHYPPSVYAWHFVISFQGKARPYTPSYTLNNYWNVIIFVLLINFWRELHRATAVLSQGKHQERFSNHLMSVIGQNFLSSLSFIVWGYFFNRMCPALIRQTEYFDFEWPKTVSHRTSSLIKIPNL